MITLTPAAIAKVKEVLKPGERLRIGIQGGGCSGFSYAMSTVPDKFPTDKEFDFDGVKVLVDMVSIMYLDGVTVDYQESVLGSGFKFDNPNAKSTCGCGQSFNAGGDSE